MNRIIMLLKTRIFCLKIIEVLPKDIFPDDLNWQEGKRRLTGVKEYSLKGGIGYFPRNCWQVMRPWGILNMIKPHSDFIWCIHDSIMLYSGHVPSFSLYFSSRPRSDLTGRPALAVKKKKITFSLFPVPSLWPELINFKIVSFVRG